MSNLDGTRTYHGDILEDITTVDISSFKSGIYTLGVIYNNNLYSFKIIKK
ncbi:T9SS type A sorting domain-containing protein [Muribaculum intestinale]